MYWQWTASFFRGLQPVPNEEVFKIYEGTHLAITKINPSNFINVGASLICLLDCNCYLYNKSFYSCILNGPPIIGVLTDIYRWITSLTFVLVFLVLLKYNTDNFLVAVHLFNNWSHQWYTSLLSCLPLFYSQRFWYHLWSITE